MLGSAKHFNTEGTGARMNSCELLASVTSVTSVLQCFSKLLFAHGILSMTHRSVAPFCRG